MTITITINTDNAAFEDNGRDQEIYNILNEYVESFGSGSNSLTRNLRDSNGNIVGIAHTTPQP